MSEATVKDGWLWFAALGSPIAWAARFTAAYPLVGFSCRTGSNAALYAVTGVALGVTFASWATAAVCARRLARPVTTSADQPRRRQRLMAYVGLGAGALFLFVMLAETVSLLFADVCADFRHSLFAPLSLGVAHAAVGGAAAQGGFGWTPDPVVLGTLAIVSLAYARGARTLRRRSGARAAIRGPHLAAAGLAIVTLAVASLSPLDALAEVLFSAHMLQHLALMVVAGPLLAFARIDTVVPWAFGPRTRRTVVRPIVAAGSRLGLSHPIVVLGLYTGVLWSWHLPSLYESALESDVVHHVEHASFLAGSVLLFRHLRVCRERAARSAGAGVLVAFGASVQGGVLGALLTFAPAAFYPTHAARARDVLSLSPLEDQQLAGLLMWIPGGVVFLAMALLLGSAWLSAAGARVRRRERHATAALLVLLGAGALAGCRGERRAVIEQGRARGEGQRKQLVFELRLTPPAPAVGELFEVETTVRDRESEEPVRGARVELAASMPEHGHGMSTAPEHVELGRGRYLTRGMKMHMPGTWVLRAAAEQGARADTFAAVLSPAVRSAASHAPWTSEELALLQSLSPLGSPPPSASNAVADDERAAELGHRLFFDPGLSADGSRSCASCHHPGRYFSDGRARAQGASRLARNTPSLLVAPWFPLLGWDGRADSVWSQALGPLEDGREMAMPRREVARHVAAAHGPDYEAVFGPLPPLDEAGATRVFVNVGKALEAYQRRLRQGPSAFDRYVAAVGRGDPDGGGHLSPAAVLGLRQFIGEGRCVLCHHGPRLSDGEFHNLALPEVEDARADERQGRSHGARALAASAFACGGAGGASGCEAVRYVDPSAPELAGAFRTPSLRNVAETAPYMHGGQLPTLEAVVAYYRSAPRAAATGDRDPVLRLVPRSLVTEGLVAFLRSLTSPPPPDRWRLPPEERSARASVRAP